MLYFARPICFVAIVAVSGLFAQADDSIQQPTTEPSVDVLPQRGPVLVVANTRLLDLITTWVDSPVETLFDGQETTADDDHQMTPTLPITRMLDAKCYLYCPSEESPIEAIYRERLANHGVKVVPVQSPNSRPSLRPGYRRQQESRTQLLTAMVP